jgi:hypothetical protein
MRKKLNRPVKIILLIFAIILVLTTAVFFAGYFYYGNLVRKFIVEAVDRESRGIYKADIGGVYLNLLSGDLTVRNIKLIPDTSGYRNRLAGDSLSPLLFGLSMERITVEDFRIMDALRHKKIGVKSIILRSPSVTVYRYKATVKKPVEKKSPGIMSIPLPKGWNSIWIGELKLHRGNMSIIDLSGDSVRSFSVPNCEIAISNILVDSLHLGNDRLFNADDIQVELDSLKFRTKNGMNDISLGKIGFSTGKNRMFVSGLKLLPLYNNYDYSRKIGWQTDRMEIYAGTVSLERVDFRDLLFTGKFSAGLLAIDSLTIDDYRDKRIPRKRGVKPPMPHEALRNLKLYLKIDTVFLTNGKAVYSEQTGKEPGKLFFDKMEAKLTGLTNDSALLAGGLISELNGTMWLMGKGKIQLHVGFWFGDRKNAFRFSATMGEIDLREINPMLAKLLPAEVVSGKVKKLVIPEAIANDDFAKGKLSFYYNDLKIAMKTEKESTWNSIKKGVVNFVANDLVVNNDNPTASGKMKEGYIYFERDKSKSIINFIWKSTLSGLKSTMGFNSKAQKELKRAEEEESKK